MAHSSGASRLALEQRAIQLAGGVLAGAADSTGAGACALCAVVAGALDLGALWASAGFSPAISAAAMTINDFGVAFTRGPALDKFDRRTARMRRKDHSAASLTEPCSASASSPVAFAERPHREKALESLSRYRYITGVVNRVSAWLTINPPTIE